MRRSNQLGLAVTAVLGLSAGAAFMPAAARGNIWVSSANGGTVSEYTNAGNSVNGNSALISGLNGANGIALSGADLYVVNDGSNTIGEYYAGNGTVINAALVSGLNTPREVAVSGSNLYVTNGNGTVGEYNAGNGTVINRALVTGLNNPFGIAVSGSNLYVTNYGNGTIGEYNAGNGTVINASLVSALAMPVGLAVSGSNLYVANSYYSTIGEYNAGNGTAVSASLVSGLNQPMDIAVLGSNLYVTNYGNNTVGEYNAGNGTAINARLISSGLNRPWGIAVTAAPNSALLTITATGTATPAYTGAGNSSSITVTNTGVGYYVPGLLNHITANGGNGSVTITGFAHNDPEIIAVALSVTDGNGTHAPTAQELTDIISDLNTGQSLATGVTSATVEAFSGNTTGTLQNDNPAAYNLLNTSETTAGGNTLNLAVLVTGTTLTSPQTFGIDFSSETADGMTAVDVTDIAVVPEPASLGLLAAGGVGVLARRRRRAA